MCKKFIVIGITDCSIPELKPDLLQIIEAGRVFSGGRRHREIMSSHLPEGYEWIDVMIPLSEVFLQYEGHESIIVFASGDPLFFGFAATLRKEFPDSEIEVFPTFNSLQLLAHRAQIPYQNMINVSLTGRPWKNLDDALISDHEIIGCLTDRKRGPAEIAARLLEFGYNNYTMTVGTSLGNEKEETVETLLPEMAMGKKFPTPNCVILMRTALRRRFFGIPEKEFFHLDGRENMITKMPVRLLTLSMLDLPHRKSLWDIGFCTGSVSIEARIQFPHLHITSFEIREESRELMEKNSRKFGAPSITSVIGDFLSEDIYAYPKPDAVFIGGHGGKLTEIVEKLKGVMSKDCVMVFNSVNGLSCQLFRDAAKSVGKVIVEEHTITLDSFNPITIMKAL